MTNNYFKITVNNREIFSKINFFKTLLFLVVFVLLDVSEIHAQRFPLNYLMLGEREIITSSKKLLKSKLEKFYASRVRKNEFDINNKCLFSTVPDKICFQNSKNNHSNLSLLQKDTEKKQNLAYRSLHIASDTEIQLEKGEDTSKNNFFSQGKKKQALIIGGGQASLAVAYFLNRYKVDYTILDSEKGPGGAWQHGWDSLRLFSPAKWSSLPGWPMPPSDEGYPSKEHVIHYLTEYEKRYNIPVERPVKVSSIKKENESFIAYTDQGEWESQVIVSTTGKWRRPFIPSYPGREIYKGQQIHSAYYQNSDPFKGQQVLIVGGGNSGAQILAEVSKVAQTRWVTLEDPLFLPDEVDGRVLFERATERWKALQEGRVVEIPKGGLGDIVMVPPVKEARARNVLKTVRPFKQFSEEGVIWQDGTYSQVDSVIWCTGFKPALDHLRELNVIEPDGMVKVNGTRSLKEPLLWLVGYGDWVGYASATLIGVTRTARDTAAQVAESLGILRRE
jgi:putative flavoprotein involved in K+ transport